MQSRWIFYITVPRDVKLPNLPLLGESSVGNVGQKAVKYIISFLHYLLSQFVFMQNKTNLNIKFVVLDEYCISLILSGYFLTIL